MEELEIKIYKKYFSEDEEILFKHIKYKNEKKNLYFFIFFFLIAIIFYILLLLSILSILFGLIFIIGIIGYIILSAIILLLGLAPFIRFVYLYFKTIIESNVSWNDLGHYKTVFMITNNHVIIKDLDLRYFVRLKKKIKPYFPDKIKKDNDWLIFDLEIFGVVICNSSKKKIIFLIEEYQEFDSINFSFENNEKSEFESANRNLRFLNRKRKKLEIYNTSLSEYDEKYKNKDDDEKRIRGDIYVTITINITLGLALFLFLPFLGSSTNLYTLISLSFVFGLIPFYWGASLLNSESWNLRRSSGVLFRLGFYLFLYWILIPIIIVIFRISFMIFLIVMSILILFIYLIYKRNKTALIYLYTVPRREDPPSSKEDREKSSPKSATERPLKSSAKKVKKPVVRKCPHCGMLLTRFMQKCPQCQNKLD